MRDNGTRYDVEETSAQRELTNSLLNSPDPHIRLVAHMAQRQLDMFEMMIEIRDEVKLLKQGQVKDRESVTSRQKDS